SPNFQRQPPEHLHESETQHQADREVQSEKLVARDSPLPKVSLRLAAHRSPILSLWAVGSAVWTIGLFGANSLRRADRILLRNVQNRVPVAFFTDEAHRFLVALGIVQRVEHYRFIAAHLAGIDRRRHHQ